MSEEILKALMQLFAIISKQDVGSTEHQRTFVRNFLDSQLNSEKVGEYLALYERKAGFHEETPVEQGEVRVSMKDSIRSLAISRKINKTLNQKQKVVVLLRLFELLKADGLYTEQRMDIINTAANVFNISKEETAQISLFTREDNPAALNGEAFLVIGEGGDPHLEAEGLHGSMRILRVRSVDLYFARYQGTGEITLNGRVMRVDSMYLLAPGSALRLPQGTIYYSDVIAAFRSEEEIPCLDFQAKDISYHFPDGSVGVRNMNLSEESGLVGIMGGSGSGKTTLLNVLSGIQKPGTGSVCINGVDIYREKEKVEGLLGYIAQDDLLMEDLSVYENLYFNARLCFRDKSRSEIKTLVENMLHKLGLYEKKDIRVGNPLNKRISGGQRKRLNIALELIREPSVLFVDEPTSGLSSRDSENVMDLLKELSRQGKLIFVVIHQPSSDIYKMLDKLVFMDQGGCNIYYGNPIEALTWFKGIYGHINAEMGECSTCGNVNPETLFNIIEAREVDDFGNYTPQRLRNPEQWMELFQKKWKEVQPGEKSELPEGKLRVPGWLRQMGIFIQRDLLSKLNNLQYVLINLLEAPLLSFILVLIIKYRAGADQGYIFRENENLPPYLFMSIIVALFIGLSVSAEEIFRDRRILKRESFLNLSRSAYLGSKVGILLVISALQTLSFVLVGNAFLEIRDMFWTYWLILLSVSLFANMLGLNISSAFNSAVTIYILIPFMVIPQMILGGAMFSFDKLNSDIGGGTHRSPVIADIMVTRWAYEALAVTQYRQNPYAEYYLDAEELESLAHYKQAFYLPELRSTLRKASALTGQKGKEDELRGLLSLLRREIGSELEKFPSLGDGLVGQLEIGQFNEDVADGAVEILEALNRKYSLVQKAGEKLRDDVTRSLSSDPDEAERIRRDLYDRNYNSFLSEVVRNERSRDKILIRDDRLIQVMDPVFLLPGKSLFSFRTHFFAPYKYMGGKLTSTFTFNLLLIILASVMLYGSLYFKIPERLINRKHTY